MKTAKIILQVNRAGAGQVQVNIQTKVNSASIRRETYNGREHWVLPSYTLPANVVMNGGLYPAAEIDAHFQKLEGTLAPLGHPTVNGQFVSAFSAEGINVGHVGAWNRNVKKSGSRVFVEKWLDIEVAKQSDGGRRLLERLEAMERGDDVPPVHTSVAVFLERLEANAGQGYEWTAKISGIDHDAILLDEPGAATPEQGVGLMVNADLATPLQANSGALVGESYRDRERRIEQAAKAQFAQGTDEYVWVADFTDTQAILVRNGGEAQLYAYKAEGGKVVFDGTGTPVVRQESWVAPIVNRFKKIFTNHQARPDKTLEGDMPLTPEEKAGLVTDIGAAVAANVAEQLKPLADQVKDLQANHKSLADTLTANARAEEAEKRVAVEAKFGKAIADSLTGNALDEAYKQCGTVAPIANGKAGEQAETGAPDPVAHFGGAK